jgi:hypothetical protein
MKAFAHAALAAPQPNIRRVRWLFIALVTVGAALRGYASFTTVGVLNNDEHQQFIEQAHRMVHGYEQRFWEQERGARHPLYWQCSLPASPRPICW